jgi:hypothetical protein
LNDRQHGSYRPEINENETRELNALLSKEIGEGDQQKNRERVGINEYPQLMRSPNTSHRSIEPHTPENERPDQPDKRQHRQVRPKLGDTLIDWNKVRLESQPIRDNPRDTYDRQVGHHEKVFKKLSLLL